MSWVQRAVEIVARLLAYCLLLYRRITVLGGNLELRSASLRTLAVMDNGVHRRGQQGRSPENDLP